LAAEIILRVQPIATADAARMIVRRLPLLAPNCDIGGPKRPKEKPPGGSFSNSILMIADQAVIIAGFDFRR
jgi:hypothetical protein